MGPQIEAELAADNPGHDRALDLGREGREGRAEAQSGQRETSGMKDAREIGRDGVERRGNNEARNDEIGERLAFHPRLFQRRQIDRRRPGLAGFFDPARDAVHCALSRVVAFARLRFVRPGTLRGKRFRLSLP